MVLKSSATQYSHSFARIMSKIKKTAFTVLVKS